MSKNEFVALDNEGVLTRDASVITYGDSFLEEEVPLEEEVSPHLKVTDFFSFLSLEAKDDGLADELLVVGILVSPSEDVEAETAVDFRLRLRLPEVDGSSSNTLTSLIDDAVAKLVTAGTIDAALAAALMTSEDPADRRDRFCCGGSNSSFFDAVALRETLPILVLLQLIGSLSGSELTLWGL